MKLTHVELIPYTVQLKTPLIVAEKTLSSREGRLIELKTDNGHTIYGDVCPLPGYSPETVNQVEHHFKQIKPHLINSHWSLKILLHQKHLISQLVPFKQLPSLHFALEISILSLLMPKLNLFNSIPTNLYVAGNDDAILKKIQLSPHFSSIKLKVGNRDEHQLAALIKKMIPKLEEHQKLRIDFNRKFSLKQLITFCEHFPAKHCEYLEEPVSNPIELLAFSNYFSHHIAFDESLFDYPLESLMTIPTKAALVLKPSLVGSLQRINYLYSKSRLHNLDFILTSCYESGLGHLAIAQLAHYLALDKPIGLDTYHLLATDVLTKPLEFDQSNLLLSDQNLMHPYLDTHQLQNCSDV